ncbi:MAG: hypothetical protein ACO32I_05355 [Candidatus Limnocylindrus sp.]
MGKVGTWLGKYAGARVTGALLGSALGYVSHPNGRGALSLPRAALVPKKGTKKSTNSESWRKRLSDMIEQGDTPIARAALGAALGAGLGHGAEKLLRSGRRAPIPAHAPVAPELISTVPFYPPMRSSIGRHSIKLASKREDAASPLRDAVLVGGGTAVGAGLGYGLSALLKARYGAEFKGVPPDARLKYLVPASAVLGGASALTHVLRQRAEARAARTEKAASVMYGWDYEPDTN